MKLGKNQIVLGGAVAVLLVGGITAGVVHTQRVQAEKVAQQAKVAYDKLLKNTKEATVQAETYESENEVKTAQNAIQKLDKKDQTEFVRRMEVVQKNWALINKAEKSVINAEKIQNDNNVKTAQTALNALKDEKIKSKKIGLQVRLDKVKTSIKNTKKQKQMVSQKGLDKVKESTATPKGSDTNVSGAQPEVSQDHTEVPVAVDQALVEPSALPNDNVYQPTPQVPVEGGGAGGENTPNPTPPPTSGGGSGTTPPPTEGGSGGGETTPPPVETFTGWVKNRAGQIVWSQGGFTTLEEAARAAAVWANAQPNPEDAWSSGAY